MLVFKSCCRLTRSSVYYAASQRLRCKFVVPAGQYFSCANKKLNKLTTWPLYQHSSRACEVSKSLQNRHESVLITSTKNEATYEDLVNTLRSKVKQEQRVVKADIENLLAKLSENQSTPEGVCSFLLQCCLDFTPNLKATEKTDLAQHIWSTFEKHGHNFNTEDIHLILEIYSSTRQTVRDNLQWVSADPNLLNDQGSQLRLLQCAAERGDLDKIATVLVRMKQLGFPVGEEVFACLVLGHGRARDYASVQSVVNTMRDAAVTPGPATYVALLQAQIENDQPIRATLTQMEAELISLTNKQISKLVNSIAMSNRDSLLQAIMSITPPEALSMELKNCAVQLVHEGHHQLAGKLIAESAIAFGQAELPNSFAAFLPRELVAANKSPEDIIAMCFFLQQRLPSHDSFLLLATEASLRDQTKTDMSSELLGHVTPLRNHFFWPLTVRTRNLRAMTAILNRMQALNLRVDYDTLAFYVFPNLITLDKPISLLKSLQKNCNLSVSSLLGPLLHALISSKLLNEALTLCSLYKTRTLDVARLIKPLSSATLMISELGVAVPLLYLLATSKHVSQKPVDVVGLFLIEYSARCKPSDLETVLKMLQQKEMNISIASYDILSARPNMKQSNLQILDSITNSRYEGTTNFNPLPHPRDMGVEELEGHLVELRAKNLNVRGTLRRLLQIHCRLNNPKRALEIKKELDTEGYNLSPGILASLFGLHLQNQDWASTAAVLEQLRKEHPSFKLDEHKILDYCTLAVQNGASESEIRSTLEQFQTTSSKHGHSIRGGPGIHHNCDSLIKSSREILGAEISSRLAECLKTLKFL